MMKAVNVHCRTGSLEMSAVSPPPEPNVHCRTGSLEKLNR
ncbi:hypothetical protein plpl0044 (plasmid) [Legionella pneumophila str. Lens]|uniref:Uncharacterized protein n=1 Tax=Legionella pneumophila (strain Lens) TaxID=297245 RepID=Q5WRW4_LEGPL|nr:hypothetical protein plpl0044 [Legionella pneumophila str. Lens]